MKTIFAWLTISLAAINTSLAAPRPVILITNLPAHGVMAPLAGRVLNADPATQAVAVFIYVPGYGWVTKPTCAQPLSPIQPNGSWSANISTGGVGDLTATRVAALLVKTNFNQPCVLGLAHLPTNIYAQSLAKTVITRASPGVRFLSFSGYDWWVKDSAGPVGPGPNYFSAATNNVWVDTNGWLHLRITKRTNSWQCAEIVSARTFGAGSYRFELNSAPDNLNPNVTLGLFTWSDDPAYTYREIDVECARWGDAADPNNSQFVVQPWDTPNHLVRYRVPAGMTNSTHLFVWETNQISFQSQTGAYSAFATNVISSYLFADAAAVPQSGDENVRLNLWLINGNPPSDNNEVEFVIKSFNFVPLDPPAPAVLGPLPHPGGGPFRGDFTTQPDYRYTVQTSPQLLDWSPLTTLLATNTTLRFTDSNTPAGNSRFYRIITQP